MRKLPWLSQPAPKRKTTESGIDVSKIRNSRRWRDKVRPQKLLRDPMCEVCLKKDKLIEAVEVDHIIPLEQGGAPFEDDNLQSICKRCHGAKTGSENSERMKAKSKKI